MATHYSRRSLYDLIWSKTMRDAAVEVGLSDVGLAKACRAAGIPIPPQGYWNKVRAGKPTEVIELPPRPPGVSDEVFGDSRYGWHGHSAADNDDEEPIPPSFDENLETVLERVRKQVGRVSVLKTLSSPHRLVERLLQADEDKRQQRLKDRYSYSWNTPVFDEPFEMRRLKILNAIFVALDHEGHKLSMRGKEARELYAQIGGQSVAFDLDAASLKKTPEWRYQYHQRPTFEANTKLKFQIWHPVETPGMRWSWVEDERKIETQLADIVVNLILAGEVLYRRHCQQAYDWRVKSLADRREQRRKAREEAERQERLRMEQDKRARVQQLFQEAENLRRAREVRDYVKAVEAATQEHAEWTARVADWSNWATQLADDLDPLAEPRLLEKFGDGSGTS